jgi:hypothetical protein
LLRNTIGFTGGEVIVSVMRFGGFLLTDFGGAITSTRGGSGTKSTPSDFNFSTDVKEALLQSLEKDDKEEENLGVGIGRSGKGDW